MELSYQYIDTLAPNASAVSNGKALAKGKFQKLCISADETLLFGECKGSGKNPYICSIDFIDKNNPIGRCSCPSRQIPCKHSLGLMYAYAGGAVFTTEEIPEDVVSKRSKIEKRAENKEKKLQEAKSQAKEASKEGKAPSKAKSAAAVKKAKAQLEGIGLAEKLLRNILQMGIAGIDSQTVKAVEGQIKELGNYYIGGIQTAFYDVLLNIKESDASSYENAVSSLLYASTLLKKASAYLSEKAENPEKAASLDPDSEIEEQIGHAWKLEELMQYDKYIENAALVQLAFYSYDDEARKEFVDEGYYMELGNGTIYRTKNYRPYKAVKYIKEDDSIYGIVEVPELFIYPGGLNPRIRWDRYQISDMKKEDYQKILLFAKDNYAETAKQIKNQIKNPLSDKNPMALLKIHDIVLTKQESGEAYLEIIDAAGYKQILLDDGYIELKSTPLVQNMSRELLAGTAMLVMYTNNIETGLLSAKPMTIITENEMVRLLY